MIMFGLPVNDLEKAESKAKCNKCRCAGSTSLLVALVMGSFVLSLSAIVVFETRHSAAMDYLEKELQLMKEHVEVENRKVDMVMQILNDSHWVMKHTVGGMQGKIDDAHATVHNNTKSVEAMEIFLQEEVDSLRGEMKDLQNNTDQLRKDIDGVDSNLNDTNKQVKEMKQTLDHVKEKMDYLMEQSSTETEAAVAAGATQIQMVPFLMFLLPMLSMALQMA